MALFKSKKVVEITKLTPKIAGKIAKKATIKPTSFDDILEDIELRAKRGYTWTYMLQVDLDTITLLENEGWTVKLEAKNEVSKNYMVKISW